MIKYYCDWCNKELPENHPSYHVQLPSFITHDNNYLADSWTFVDHFLCKECLKEIWQSCEAIKSIRKGRYRYGK